MSISLVPFGPVGSAVLTSLQEGLAAVFGSPVEIGPVRDLVPGACDPQRRQYLASAFLEALESLNPRHGRVLGVTAVDLYAPGLNFVFGQAGLGGGVCVISLSRLFSPADAGHLFPERVLKEAVHELGHTFGLGHCPDPQCVMHFSNTLADTDRKSSTFCPRCRPALFP